MAFIDFVSLLLVNMTAGLALLAVYLVAGLDDPDQPRWGLGFIGTGTIAFLFGGYMCLVWPLPGPYNCAFGETSVLLGIIFLMAGVGMTRGWKLEVVAGYALFAGLASIIVGARVISLHLTKTPLWAGIGFILTGVAGVGALPTLLFFRHSLSIRILGALVLLAAALIWAVTVYPEYWVHLQIFSKWTPAIMQHVSPAPPPAP